MLPQAFQDLVARRAEVLKSTIRSRRTWEQGLAVLELRKLRAQPDQSEQACS